MLMMLAARPAHTPKGAADAHDAGCPGPAYTPKSAAYAQYAGCRDPPTRPRAQLMLMMLAARPAHRLKGAADAHGCPAFQGCS